MTYVCGGDNKKEALDNIADYLISYSYSKSKSDLNTPNINFELQATLSTIRYFMQHVKEINKEL